MSDFSKELDAFKKYGTYNYRFDDGNNLTFNASSSLFNQVYLSLPLKNVIYDTEKIKKFYTVDFEEFVPTTPVVETVEPSTGVATQSIQVENEALKTELERMIAENSTTIDPLAIKQVILELRKSLGQGRIDSDFSEDFPYTPKSKPIETDV